MVVVATVPSLDGVVPSPAKFQNARLPRVGVTLVAIAAVSVPDVVIATPWFWKPDPAVMEVTVPEFWVRHVEPIA